MGAKGNERERYIDRKGTDKQGTDGCERGRREGRVKQREASKEKQKETNRSGEMSVRSEERWKKEEGEKRE